MVLEQNYMQGTNALANNPTHASHNCRRTNAMIQIKAVAMDAKPRVAPWAMARHYYSIPPLLF